MLDFFTIFYHLNLFGKNSNIKVFDCVGKNMFFWAKVSNRVHRERSVRH